MIKSSAPTRIDLAGGTLDIWPLYLNLDKPSTLNVAINLYATVKIVPRKDKKIIVESKDLGIKAGFGSMASLPDRHPLQLIFKTLKFYEPKTGLTVTTNCEAPQGSGIGGSSALSIALNGAFNALTGRNYKKSQLIEIAKNIETQVLGVPTGWQDYFPALYGGALSIEPGLLGVEYQKLSVDPEELTRRFVLCYTGKPRNSGINNWEILKKAIDGNRKVISDLEKINRTTQKMRDLLFKGKIESIPPLFDEEWRARKALAPGISTPKMDRLIAAAKRKGALAAKVCGAGGGCCVAFMVKREKKEQVAEELKKQGARVLDFRCVKRGLRISREP